MSFNRLEADDFVVSADSITAGYLLIAKPQKLLHFLPLQLKAQAIQVIIT